VSCPAVAVQRSGGPLAPKRCVLQCRQQGIADGGGEVIEDAVGDPVQDFEEFIIGDRRRPARGQPVPHPPGQPVVLCGHEASLVSSPPDRTRSVCCNGLIQFNTYTAAVAPSAACLASTPSPRAPLLA